MNDGWYESVSPATRLTQGDLVFGCPISTWAAEAASSGTSDVASEVPEVTPQADLLKKRQEIIAEDVIVMSQACDLEHGKVSDVVVCPHYALSYFREQVWKPDQERKGHKLNTDHWQKYFKGMASGHLWNLCVVNSSEIDGNAIEHRVVDFHRIYTIPRDFLETLLQERNKPRLRLLPPYREHLSQAFARFFMRVGLPEQLNKAKT